MGAQPREAAAWLVISVFLLFPGNNDGYSDPRRFGQNTDSAGNTPSYQRYGAQPVDGVHASRKRLWEEQREKMPAHQAKAPDLRGSRPIQPDQGGMYNRQQTPTSAPTAGVVLPAGWKSAKDAKGRTYFYHSVTKWTSWSFPDPKTMIFNHFPIRVPDGMAAALKPQATPQGAVILEEGVDVETQMDEAPQGALVLCRGANETRANVTTASQSPGTEANAELPREETSGATSSPNVTVGAAEKTQEGVGKEIPATSTRVGVADELQERKGDTEEEGGGVKRGEAEQAEQGKEVSEADRAAKVRADVEANETRRHDAGANQTHGLDDAANTTRARGGVRGGGLAAANSSGEGAEEEAPSESNWGGVVLSWGKLLGLRKSQHVHIGGPGSAQIPTQSNWWRAEGVESSEKRDAGFESVMGRRVRWSGRWWLREETVGSMTGVESEWETDEPLFPLLLVSGSPWLMQNCSFQCNIATAVKVCLSGKVELRFCLVGGFDEDRRCADALQVKDTAHASAWCCLLRFSGTVNRMLRVYGGGFCVARNCTLAEMGFAVSLDEIACVILDECRIVAPKICAFFRQFSGRAARLQLIRTQCDGDYLWYNGERPIVTEVDCVWSTTHVEGAWEEYTRRQRDMMNTGIEASLGEAEADEWREARQAAKKTSAAGSAGDLPSAAADGGGHQHVL